MLNTHKCELLMKQMEGSELDEDKYKRYSKIIRSWVTIYLGHPKCHHYLISSAAANKNRRQHDASKYWWIVHPLSKLRLFWESVMVVVYFVAFLTIPFSLCFIIMDYDEVLVDNLNPLVYIFCWIDIIGHCVTGFYDRNDDDVTFDLLPILKRYLKGFMIIDIITSLPYDRLLLQWREPPSKDDTVFWILLNLTPSLKLLRYFTFTSYINQIFLYFDSDYVSCQMFLTVLLYLYVIHWFACFCHLNPLISMWADEDISSLLPSNNQLNVIYETSLYIVLENLTASGYGGKIPNTEGQILVRTVLMIIGRLFECYIIIMLLQIVSDRKASESKYEQIVNQLCAYARQKQLPTYMKKRLLAYYHFRFRNSYFRERKILTNLSDSLREEVVLHSCRRLVENVDIFQDLPRHVLVLIVTNLKPELYLARDMIVKAGTQGDCMFFLSSGTVAVLTPTGKEVCFLEDGAHFGEVALLVQDQRRVASVVAVEVCEVYRLDRKDFRKCIAAHTDLFSKVERIATERMQRTVMVEERHKRSISTRKSK